MTSASSFAQNQAPMVLQFDKPATYFEESLPIGNGKIGALVYGGTDDNIIYLNDITLWTGKPVDRNLDADAHKWLPAIREALFKEDYQLADSLQLHIQGPNSQYYQPLGTLHIKDLRLGAITDYQRSLDIDSAIVRDSYTRDGKLVTLIAVTYNGRVDIQRT
jgi:alpha-L-fucosidase 2